METIIKNIILWGKKQLKILEKEPVTLKLNLNRWVKIQITVFFRHKTHQTIRHTQVLEEKNRKKTHSTAALLPPVSQVSYIETIRCTPIFLPNLGAGGSASYSPKNMVVKLKMEKISTIMERTEKIILKQKKEKEARRRRRKKRRRVERQGRIRKLNLHKIEVPERKQGDI